MLRGVWGGVPENSLGEPESPPVLLHFPERIVFVLSEEERPARREVEL